MGEQNKQTDVINGLHAPKTTKLNFYIFGNNISHSLSPTLHNAGFKNTRLPSHYSIFETEHVDESVKRLMDQPDFGGASVTFPHKLEVQCLIDAVSEKAKTIGAVNTIIVRDTPQGRVLEGDNTDWTGIKTCIERGHLDDLPSSTAVIFGAGGAARAACFAVETVGIRELVIVNRTRQTAQAMADNFPNLRSQICSALDEVNEIARLPVRVIIGCIPADEFGEDKIPDTIFAGSNDGVLVEMAYRPLVTGMMLVARRHNGWKVFKGMDVLQEQAFAQFELWTGRKAPTDVMIRAMNEELKRREAVKI